jgi:hypothetical protein
MARISHLPLDRLALPKSDARHDTQAIKARGTSAKWIGRMPCGALPFAIARLR